MAVAATLAVAANKSKEAVAKAGGNSGPVSTSDAGGVNDPLFPDEWMNSAKESSSVSGLVSSAHRALIQERDNVLKHFIQELCSLLQRLYEKYGHMLQQEESWKIRWNRQVEMLRKKNVRKE
jgi:hypothetical protein